MGNAVKATKRYLTPFLFDSVRVERRAPQAGAATRGGLERFAF
jgi:hypothetical protein